MSGPVLGILGGSGLYEIAGLKGAAWRHVESPFGTPSDAILTGTLDGLPLAFLPRHGRGHVHSPTSVPYRANIDALKRLGVTHLLSLSATGSFREEMAPGDFVMVDQFIDRTVGRAASFFGPGCVAHVSLAHPVCAGFSRLVGDVAESVGARVHRGGTYLAMEGPQFSTLAESRLYREVWGCDVIGMTNMPEARLAREAEMHYCPVAMVTDYDCWHPDHGAVEVADIVRTLGANAATARALLGALPPQFPPDCTQACDRALDTALITAPEARDAGVLARLDAVAGRVLNRG